MSERPPLWQRKQVRPYDRLQKPLPPATLRRILEANGLREGHHYTVLTQSQITGKKYPAWGLQRMAWHIFTGGLLLLAKLPFLEAINDIYQDIELKQLLKLKEKLKKEAENNRLKYRKLPEYAMFTTYGREVLLLSRDAAATIRALKKYKATVNLWKNDPKQPLPNTSDYSWLKKL